MLTKSHAITLNDISVNGVLKFKFGYFAGFFVLSLKYHYRY